MYATPKPSGTTSPQPYGPKCFENTAEVLSTHVLARCTTGSANTAGSGSPSRRDLRGPSERTNTRRSATDREPRQSVARTQQMSVDPEPGPRPPRARDMRLDRAAEEPRALLRRLLTTYGVYANACVLGVRDEGLWAVLGVAWEVLAVAVAADLMFLL